MPEMPIARWVAVSAEDHPPTSTRFELWNESCSQRSPCSAPGHLTPLPILHRASELGENGLTVQNLGMLDLSLPKHRVVREAPRVAVTSQVADMHAVPIKAAQRKTSRHEPSTCHLTLTIVNC